MGRSSILWLAALATILLGGACGGETFIPGGFDGSVWLPGSEVGVGPLRPSCVGRETTLSGTVLAPNGKDPVPGATVFIPAQTPEIFPPEVKCEVCGQLGSTPSFWLTVSAVDGKFTLRDVCPGPRSLVLQNGRFRRIVQLQVPEKAEVQLTPEETRLPRRATEADPGDSIPRIAVATGDYDKMECVLRKMGLDDSAIERFEGAKELRSPTPLPEFGTLLGDLSRMRKYNIIFINCTQNTFEGELAKPGVRNNIASYVQSGGRLYVTDWSYDWIEQVEAFSSFIDFQPTPSGPAPEPINEAALGEGELKVQATIKDPQLASWLGLFPGVINQGKVPLDHFLVEWVMIRSLTNDVKLWVEGPVRSIDGSINGTLPLTLTFNFKNCGKILFTSYHTEGRTDEFLGAKPYPAYCGSSFSPQDRILEYLIFDIASCVKPVD